VFSMFPSTPVRAEIIELEPTFTELEPIFTEIVPAIDIAMPLVKGAQILLDTLGIVSGILPTSTCVCTGIISCPPDMCVNNPTLIQQWEARHNTTLAAAEKNAATHTFSPEKVGERMDDTLRRLDNLEGGKTNRPLPPPPPNPSPGWAYLGVAGAGLLHFFTFRMEEEQLETILGEHTENTKTILEEQGFYFCFINQDFRELVPSQPPPISEHIIGFHNGVPIVDRNAYLHVWDEAQRIQILGAHLVSSATVHGIRFDMGSRAFRLNTTTISANIFVNGEERNAGLYSSRNTTVNSVVNYNIMGMFITRNGTNWHTLRQMGSVTYLRNNTQIRHVITSGEVIDFHGALDTVINPPARPAVLPTITLAPNNTLQDLSGVMNELRNISGQVDELREQMVVMFPIITPEMFPQIPQEYFADFARELKEQLTREDIVMPAEEARPIIINIPPFPDINITQPPIIIQPRPPGTETEQHLINIQRQLEQQNRKLGDMPGAIANKLPNITLEVEYFDSAPFLFDFSGLFDSMPNLMEYFPFSLPFDLYNTFRVIAGQMPVETVGMTLQEARAFTALMENPHQQDKIMALHGGHVAFQLSYAGLEPMFLTSTAPRFEIEIPEPFNYTFVFDMNDYTALIGVVRWSLLLIFVIGLYKLTPLLIRW